MRDQSRVQMGYGGVFRNAVVACFAALLLLISGAVQAASLGEIEVASPLGEPLYAEVPLKLEGNELASKVFIEIASSSDYKIFEVYRDPVLDSIRADVASDERGARVKLTSRIGMQTPFFSLVLKVRYGRVSHFKKYSVFLDSAKPIQQVVEKSALPYVQAVVPDLTNTDGVAKAAQSNGAKLTESAGKALISEQDLQAAKQQLASQQSSPKAFEGWARTGKYGPIVRGDSLFVVAQRLRTDQRYSISQIMVALFEKNTSSFKQDNMNLMQVESFLEVPTATEVEKHNKSEASRISTEHKQAWQQKPRYAVEAETQRTRYSNRVSIGEEADGVTNTSIAKPVQTLQDSPKVVASDKTNAVASAEKTVVETDALEPVKAAAISPQLEQLIQAQSETNELLVALQQKNAELQQQLIDNKKSVDALNNKIDEGTTAASNARVEKLEILLTRLQAELEKQSQQSASQVGGSSDWVTWILLSLLIVMLGVIAMLMRKEPTHPSSVVTPQQAVQAEQPRVKSKPEAASLQDVVEEEVGNIETDEDKVSLAKATGTFDAMSSFNDELSDTDTAELEPFDADARQEPDPNVDYLSEADVYIRYGMDDEALQQLNMALRLNPDNGNAHIKKAELLHGKQDKAGLAAAVVAATAVLADSELDRYQSCVEAFAGDVDALADESVVEAESVETSPVTVALDDVDMDDLDFDLSNLEVTVTDSDVAMVEILEPVDLQVEGGAEQQAEYSETEAPDELDWLSDPAFEGAEDAGMSGLESVQSDGLGLAPELQTKGGGATQQLDDLLGEFPGAENTQTLDEDVLNTGKFDVDEGKSFDAQSELTQDLDSLLSDFAEQDDVEADLSHLEVPGSDAPDVGKSVASPADDALDASATQRLDHLLGEFSDDDDDLSFDSSNDSFDTSIIEQAKAAATDASDADAGDTDDAIAIGTDYGATQELDSLLSEFADEDDGLSSIEPIDVATTEQKSLTDGELDHGATQELDSLLGEFAEADNASDDIDQGATQVLGHLLDEFSDDEDDKKKG